MNKTKFIFWVLFIFMGISLMSSSCKDHDDELELSGASSFDIDADGNSVSFNVSSNVSWIITGNKSWVRVNPQSGSGSKVVTVTVDANTTAAERSCSLEVKSNDGKLGFMVQINQKGLTPTLSVSPGYIEFEAKFETSAGKEKTFQVQCNTEWTLSGVPDWLRADPLNGTKNGTVRLTALSQNSDLANREATITVTAGNATATISVSQATSIANCSAKIKSDSEIILKDGYYADIDFSSNVKGYYSGYIKVTDAKPYTQQELYEAVQHMDNYSPDEYDYEVADGLSTNTEYILCILPYIEEKGNRIHGPLTQRRFRTKSTDKSADAPFDYITYDSSRWRWGVLKNPKCNKYYMGYYQGDDALYIAAYYYSPDILLAYFTKQLIKAGKIDYSINQRDYADYMTSNVFVVWTWGVSDQGEFSGNINKKAVQTSTRSAIEKADYDNMASGRKKFTRTQLVELAKHINIKVVR